MRSHIRNSTAEFVVIVLVNDPRPARNSPSLRSRFLHDRGTAVI
jgi:hypothetical protein